MPHIDADRVLETSTTTGAGNIVLAGSVSGYRAIAGLPGMADGTTVDLYVEDVLPATGVPTGNWECGTYTWRTGGILERTTVRASSNGGAAVSWGLGMRRIGMGMLSYMVALVRALPQSYAAAKTELAAEVAADRQAVEAAAGAVLGAADTVAQQAQAVQQSADQVSQDAAAVQAVADEFSDSFDTNWTDPETAYTGLRVAVTDVGSAAASKLLELLRNGASMFSVDKVGAVAAASLALAGGLTVGGAASAASMALTGALAVGGNAGVSGGTLTLGSLVISALGSDRLSTPLNWGYQVENSTTGLRLGSAGVAFGAATYNTDTFLLREAAGVLGLRNGVNPQAFRVYNTFTDASNYERGFFRFSASVLEIGTEMAGTGSGRSIIFMVGGAQRWFISGNFMGCAVDNTIDFGASGANRPRTGYFGTSLFTPLLRVGATNGTAMGNDAVALGNVAFLGWTSAAGTDAGAYDVRLYRDAAGALAQRNGAATQEFRLYDAYTDTSNYSRLQLSASVGDHRVVSGHAGTGTAKNLMLGTLGSSSILLVTAGTTRWQVQVAGHLIAQADNTYDIGGSAANRPRNVHIANGLFLGSGAYPYGSGPGIYVGGNKILEKAGNSTAIWNAVVTTNPYLTLYNGAVNLGSTLALSWSSTADPNATTDLLLYRDAAGVLALRNGVNAQALRIYNTYTDAANNEYAGFYWNANRLFIGVVPSGTGVRRTLGLMGLDISFETNGAVRWKFDSTGQLVPFATNSYDLGSSTLTVRTGYFGTSVITPKLRTTPGTLASLGTAAAAGDGTYAFINDCAVAHSGNAGVVATGGGANKAPVYSDGVNWIIG